MSSNQMISTFVILILFSVCILEVRCEDILQPLLFVHWGAWYQSLINYHLTKLSSELYRDGTKRMVIVNKNAEAFESNIMFATGTVAANMQGYFEKMIGIYRKISDIETTEKRYWFTFIRQPLHALSVTQSLYHKLKLEKKILGELKKKYMTDRDESIAALKKKLGDKLPKDYEFKAGMSLKGGMSVARRLNIDDLFDDNDFDRNFQIPILAKQTAKQRKMFSRPSNKTLHNNLNVKAAAPNPYVPRPKKIKIKSPTPDYVKLIPSDFDLEPPNSSVFKLMSQLNKDNPDLNPDLDTYLERNRRHRRPNTGGMRYRDNEDLRIRPSSNRYGIESRRSGSISLPKIQLHINRPSSSSQTWNSKTTNRYNIEHSSETNVRIKLFKESESNSKKTFKVNGGYYTKDKIQSHNKTEIQPWKINDSIYKPKSTTSQKHLSTKSRRPRPSHKMDMYYPNKQSTIKMWQRQSGAEKFENNWNKGGISNKEPLWQSGFLDDPQQRLQKLRKRWKVEELADQDPEEYAQHYNVQPSRKTEIKQQQQQTRSHHIQNRPVTRPLWHPDQNSDMSLKNHEPNFGRKPNTRSPRWKPNNKEFSKS